LKPLPSSPRYDFLGPNSTYPVIVKERLRASQIDSLLRILRMRCKTIGYTLADLKRVHPFVCLHCILMEDDHKPSVEHQRRINLNVQEVVKKEILKLLKASIIYPIFNSKWVSPGHVVPKKRRMMIIRNKNNEQIPTRILTG